MQFTITYIIIIYLFLLTLQNIKQFFIKQYEIFSYENVYLSDFNLLKINGKIDKETVNNLINQLDNSLLVRIPVKHNVKVFINSNGGEVYYGAKLINKMNNLNKVHFECYALSAKSIAFDIFQHCHTRIIVPSTVLLQHNATIKFEGTFEELEDFVNVAEQVNDINRLLDRFVANKIKMTFKEYKLKISKTWTLEGEEIIQNKLADKIVVIRNLEFLI